jgi:hypothetical protein
MRRDVVLKTTVWRCAPKLAGLAVALAMCSGPARAGGDLGKGAVYMMTNQVAGNQLAVFARDGQGLLEFPFFYPTGGIGTGSGLGEQGAIAIDDDGDTLYVVNAGSDTISVFDLTKKEPTLIDIVSSGGTFPNSIALSGDLLYVLNAGCLKGQTRPLEELHAVPQRAVGAPRPGQLFPEQQLACRDREERQ